MSDRKVMTILVLFHLKSYGNLKHFYINHVCKHMRDEFPYRFSYNRFVELQKGCSSWSFYENVLFGGLYRYFTY